MIASALGAVLGNLFIVFFLIAVIVAAAKARRRSARGRELADILWRELVFYAVGLNFVWYATLHAYFGTLTSKFIGWEPSPYEWELAWAEYGIAAVALLSMWSGAQMRLAATVAFAVFSLGAAAQHIHEIFCCANNNPGNAGPILWFGDIALPLLIFALAAASRLRAASRRAA